MSLTKRLKGIALGLLGTFVSRNNDIHGYWGIGKLRRFADAIGRDEIVVDLLDSTNGPELITPTTIARDVYREWLSNTAPKFRVRFEDLVEARIIMRFTTFEEIPDVTRDTRGFPYVCTVKLREKFGRQFSAVKLGVSSPHDPQKESRRYLE